MLLPNAMNGYGAVGGDWFHQQRDRFMRVAFDEFFDLIGAFYELYATYLKYHCDHGGSWTELLDRQSEEVRSRIWNQLTAMVGDENEKGPLWLLKDLCHKVWPETGRAHHFTGSLFDWLIGAIFHEAMKLKENIYLLNSYGPAAYAIDDLSGGYLGERRGATFAKMIDIQGLVNRIAADVVRQMEQVGFLFGQANYLLRILLTECTGNTLVIRLLAEREEVVELLWGESLEGILSDMFGGDVTGGFCAAGRSYFSGQWFANALAMYRRALAVDQRCDEAVVKAAQLEAILQENKALFDNLDSGDLAHTIR